MITDLEYLACPYNDDSVFVRVERFEAVNRAAAELLKQGRFIFSPISHTHPIACYGLPKGFDFWEPYDRQFLDICKGLIVLCLPGWKESSGVQWEIEYMKKLGRPVEYLEP